MRPPSVVIGDKFGRLTICEFAGSVNGKRTWRCACECDGKSIVVTAGNLRSGNTRSCGCDQKEAARVVKTVHGLSRKFTSEYWAWESMHNRCSREKNARYKDYGGRGIKVCERWDNFAFFLEDMGAKPTAKHSLDRTDNDGNYEPSNCRWVTSSEQRTNQRPRKQTSKGEYHAD